MIDTTVYLANLKAMFIELFPIVSSEEWTAWVGAEVTALDGTVTTTDPKGDLNKLMHAIDKMFNDKLRPTYDRTIWNGHKSGKVSQELRPVRAATIKADSVKPVPTAEELFDSLIG